MAAAKEAPDIPHSLFRESIGSMLKVVWKTSLNDLTWEQIHVVGQTCSVLTEGEGGTLDMDGLRSKTVGSCTPRDVMRFRELIAQLMGEIQRPWNPSRKRRAKRLEIYSETLLLVLNRGFGDALARKNALESRIPEDSQPLFLCQAVRIDPVARTVETVEMPVESLDFGDTRLPRRYRIATSWLFSITHRISGLGEVPDIMDLTKIRRGLFLVRMGIKGDDHPGFVIRGAGNLVGWGTVYAINVRGLGAPITPGLLREVCWLDPPFRGSSLYTVDPPRHRMIRRSPALTRAKVIGCVDDFKLKMLRRVCITASPKLLCSNCEREESFRLCGACMTQRYCSRECQREHWQRHRDVCMAHRRKAV